MSPTRARFRAASVSQRYFLFPQSGYLLNAFKRAAIAPKYAGNVGLRTYVMSSMTRCRRSGGIAKLSCGAVVDVDNPGHVEVVRG